MGCLEPGQELRALWLDLCPWPTPSPRSHTRLIPHRPGNPPRQRRTETSLPTNSIPAHSIFALIDALSPHPGGLTPLAFSVTLGHPSPTEHMYKPRSETLYPKRTPRFHSLYPPLITLAESNNFSQGFNNWVDTHYL